MKHIFRNLKWPATRQQVIDYIENEPSVKNVKGKIISDIRENMPEGDHQYNNPKEFIEAGQLQKGFSTLLS